MADDACGTGGAFLGNGGAFVVVFCPDTIPDCFGKEGALPGIGGAFPGIGGALLGIGGALLGIGGALPGIGGALPGIGGALKDVEEDPFEFLKAVSPEFLKAGLFEFLEAVSPSVPFESNAFLMVGGL